MRKFWLATAMALSAAAPGLAAAEDTITIGLTVSQTGPLNVDSVAQLRGSEFWRDEVNAKGGIKAGNKRYKVRLVTYDDQSVGGRVQQLYTRLIVQDKANFLFGPYSSGLTATAAVISEQYGKVMLIGGGAEPKTYQLGNKYLFQCITQADFYLAGAVQALKEKNPHAKVAFVYSDDPFSKAVVASAHKLAQQAGFSIALEESYAPSTTDFSPIINKVISSGADAFLGGGHYPDGATLARQLHEQKAGLKYIAILVAPDSPKFASLGDAALGVMVPSQWEPQVKYKPDFGPTPEQFAKAAYAKTKVEADYHTASGYITGLLLQHAIEKAGSIDPEKVKAELDKIEVNTFFGNDKFATDAKNHGLQTGHQMVLAQWQSKNGKLVKEIVWPDGARTAPLLYPLAGAQ
ncbi:MAG TPA: amino acid ABC transporter substrate-binding protein [Burkholderiales bacterium]|jgi:branched-chain amino acid transport system substrate-binding protein|nr:amino acid ABC transporter substrate-binding protein [Burkholderiales bacterium]